MSLTDKIPKCDIIGEDEDESLSIESYATFIGNINESVKELNEKLKLYDMILKNNRKVLVLREHEKRKIIEEIFGDKLTNKLIKGKEKQNENNN